MAISQTIKGTGKNSGTHSVYIGARDTQIHYIGSKEWIDGLKKRNEKRKASAHAKRFPHRQERFKLNKLKRIKQLL